MTYPALDKESTASTSATPKRYAGYTVYDPLGQKIGSAEEVFVTGKAGRSTSGCG